MQNVVHAGTSRLQSCVVGNVSVAEIKFGSNAVQVFLPAMRKIVNATDFFALRNQRVRYVGANKTGNAGDEVFRHPTSIAFAAEQR